MAAPLLVLTIFWTMIVLATFELLHELLSIPIIFFFRMGYIMLNGGNKYTKWFSQLIDIASIFKTWGSGIQETYLCNCSLRLDAETFISGTPKHAIKWLKMFLDSIHSDASSNVLNAVSPNIYAAFQVHGLQIHGFLFPWITSNYLQ